MWPSLSGTDAGVGIVRRREGEIGEDFERRSLRVLEGDRLGDAGRDVAAPLALDAGLLQPRRQFAEIAARRDLERQPRRFDGAAALQHDRLLAGFYREDRAVLVARHQREADDAGEVVDLALDVGRRQRGMASSLDLQHGGSPGTMRNFGRLRIRRSDARARRSSVRRAPGSTGTR